MRRVRFPALQGHHVIARGEAPGNASAIISQALQGRPNRTSARPRRFVRAECFAPSGRGKHRRIEPGALPRAITWRPFRATLAAETQRLTRLYEQKQAALAELKKSLLHQAFSGEL